MADAGSLAALSNFMAARLQMALTLGYHIVIACLGVGLPVLLLAAEWRYVRTGDWDWKILAHRWSRAFAVLFAVGAVTGTVLSFEFGLLWPAFMGTFGSVIGMPFTLEAFAFFLEGIFVGIYLYTWDRLSPFAHWLTGIPIALAGLLSAWFVVTANAWMNAPQGFTMENGRVVEANPWEAMLNPATWPQTIHMIVAAYMVAGFLVAAYYAFEWLRGDRSLYVRRAVTSALILAGVFAVIQPFVGDQIGKMVAETQPVKLAALEGQFETEQGAPLRIGGIPDQEAEVTRYAIAVPKLLSFLAYGDPDAEVLGLKDVPDEDEPPVLIVHLAFQIMVAIGLALAALALWAGWYLLRRRPLPNNSALLIAIIASGPLSVIALEAGWIVTEVGRQPWIVQGVMRTEEAVTTAKGIQWLPVITVAAYIAITVGAIRVLRILRNAQDPTEGGDES